MLFQRQWADAWRHRLLASYAEPTRHYHRLQHLPERPGEVAVALWFHDALTSRWQNTMKRAGHGNSPA